MEWAVRSYNRTVGCDARGALVSPRISGRLISVGVGLLEIPPTEYAPEDPSDFGIWITIVFGAQLPPNDRMSAARMYTRLWVCSVSWLSREFDTGGVLAGRGLMIVDRFEGDRITEAIARFAQSCISKTIDGLFRKMLRIGFAEDDSVGEPPEARGYLLSKPGGRSGALNISIP